MTYREHMQALGVATSALLRGGGQVDAADLDVALSAQTALARLLRTVHTDVTGVVRPVVKLDLRGLEHAPVAVLSRLLLEHPTPAPLPISEVVGAVTHSPAAELWRQVARHATVAEHDWRTAAPATRPTGDARWSELADVAALGEGLAILSGDLSESLAAAARSAEATTFRRASTSGLATTAGAVRRVAQGAPLPDPGEVTPLPTRRVLAVQDAEQLPAAFTRLGHQLRTAADLSPGHVQLVARALATASLAGADGLEAAGETAFGAGLLRIHADRLAQITSAPQRVASLAPSEPAALAQAQQIHEWIATARRRGWVPTADQAVEIGHGVVDVTAALDVAVRHQVDTSRWLTRREGAPPGLREWRRMGAVVPEPELVRLVSSAARHADTVRSALPPRAAPTRRGSPRVALAAALATRHPPVRPGFPNLNQVGRPRRR